MEKKSKGKTDNKDHQKMGRDFGFRLHNDSTRAEWKDEYRLQSLLQLTDLKFRDGFPQRTTSRLINLLENKVIVSYYASLSRFLPRVFYGSLIILAATLLLLFLLNGNLSPEVLMGKEPVNESNFISYLIFVQ